MDALTVALIGGLLGGAAAAVLGGLITLTTQRREHAARVAEANGRHAHEHAMAREQRLQDRRARAYERALEHAYRIATWIDRTEPFMGPVPEPPPPLPDAEMWSLNAVTAAHATPSAQALALAMSSEARTFQIAVWRRQSERESGREDGLQPPPMIALTQARDAYHVKVREFGDRLAAELRGEVN